MIPNEVLKKIKDFHGHGGPWAALGFRAGILAKEILKPEKIKEMKAHIILRYDIPYSCFLDGIQLGSCCTVGKRNLSFSDSNDIPISVFETNDKKIKIEIKPNVVGKITPANDEKTVWVLKQDVGVLFYTQKQY